MNKRDEQVRDPEGASTSELLREALSEARQLVATELEIARQELRVEVRKALSAALAAGAATFAATVGVTMGLVGLSMAVRSWVLALCIGAGFLALAAGFALLGYSSLPKKILPTTTRRLVEDARVVEERLA